MSVVIIAYPPSAGGNHLKNILLMDHSWENSYELNLDPYNRGDREVHSTPGRNMQEYKLQNAKGSVKDYLLHGHFGELTPYRDQINSIEDKKFILITIDTERDKYLLNRRQHKLGQQSHPYYLYEEQEYLYQPQFYQIYFTANIENVYTISLNEFWHPNLNQYGIVNRLNSFLNKSVDAEEAQVLHRHWHINNHIDFY